MALKPLLGFLRCFVISAYFTDAVIEPICLITKNETVQILMPEQNGRHFVFWYTEYHYSLLIKTSAPWFKRQAITWTNDDPVLWRIHLDAFLSLIEFEIIITLIFIVTSRWWDYKRARKTKNGVQCLLIGWQYQELGHPHGPLTRYVKFWVAHAPGMPGTFSPPLTWKDTAS